MYRIAVCDDNQADVFYVSRLIKKWAAENNVTVHLEDFPSAEAFLFHYEEEKNFDILFLDIEMGEISGMALAKKIREMDSGIPIIFVTGYMDYIADGYEVEALHYLLKPVTEEKIGSVLVRAVERQKHREKSVYLPSNGSMVLIPISKIRYLEVRKNYVTIHWDEDITVKKTLGELEKELDDSFFRTGRSFIVNLRFVSKITKWQVILKDGVVIPLSRNLYENINRAMIDYF